MELLRFVVEIQLHGLEIVPAAGRPCMGEKPAADNPYLRRRRFLRGGGEDELDGRGLVGQGCRPPESPDSLPVSRNIATLESGKSFRVPKAEPAEQSDIQRKQQACLTVAVLGADEDQRPAAAGFLEAEFGITVTAPVGQMDLGEVHLISSCWAGSREKAFNTGRDIAGHAVFAQARLLLNRVGKLLDELKVDIVAAAKLINDLAGVFVFEAGRGSHAGSGFGSAI